MFLGKVGIEIASMDELYLYAAAENLEDMPHYVIDIEDEKQFDAVNAFIDSEIGNHNKKVGAVIPSASGYGKYVFVLNILDYPVIKDMLCGFLDLAMDNDFSTLRLIDDGESLALDTPRGDFLEVTYTPDEFLCLICDESNVETACRMSTGFELFETSYCISIKIDDLCQLESICSRNLVHYNDEIENTYDDRILFVEKDYDDIASVLFMQSTFDENKVCFNQRGNTFYEDSDIIYDGKNIVCTYQINWPE